VVQQADSIARSSHLRLMWPVRAQPGGEDKVYIQDVRVDDWLSAPPNNDAGQDAVLAGTAAGIREDHL
jgi:hypothetical protein